MNNDIILDIQNVTKRSPGVIALDDVSMQIRRGEIHGLCGENGAGKSTLMKILSGVYPYGTYEGKILYEGDELKFETRAIHQAMEQGIAIVYQELTLVPGMTVGENVYLGKEPSEKGVINWDKLYADTQSILRRYRLEVEPHAETSGFGFFTAFIEFTDPEIPSRGAQSDFYLFHLSALSCCCNFAEFNRHPAPCRATKKTPRTG